MSKVADRPFVIAVDGPDGVGKTSYIKNLKFTLERELKGPVKVVQMMPDGPVRALLLSSAKLHPVTVAALVKEAAIQAKKQVDEALSCGFTVLMDRCDVSWNVYNASVLESRDDVAAGMSMWRAYQPHVDCGVELCIILKAPPEVLLDRLKRRNPGSAQNDRFEHVNLEYITKKCDQYSAEIDRLSAKAEIAVVPRVMVFDTSELPEEIMADITAADIVKELKNIQSMKNMGHKPKTLDNESESENE